MAKGVNPFADDAGGKIKPKAGKKAKPFGKGKGGKKGNPFAQKAAKMAPPFGG